MAPAGLIQRGTTSACAENTTERQTFPLLKGNYLRVRGEYGFCPRPKKQLLELPPRARRIRPCEGARPQREGTTSACAENTSVSILQRNTKRNYLRVRGEYKC